MKFLASTCSIVLFSSISIIGSALADNPIELVVGGAQFFNADHIWIDSVTSSQDGFEIGAVVTVKGTYTLNSLDAATLSFNSTIKLKPGQKPTATPVEDSQRMKATRGTHTFSLSKTIKSDGAPHLTFYHPDTGKPFGGVYFGDKSNVLMAKSWSYQPPSP